MVKDCFIAQICANFGAPRGAHILAWRTSLRDEAIPNKILQYEHCIGTIPKKMPTKNELKRGVNIFVGVRSRARGIGLSAGTVVSAPS